MKQDASNVCNIHGTCNLLHTFQCLFVILNSCNATHFRILASWHCICSFQAWTTWSIVQKHLKQQWNHFNVLPMNTGFSLLHRKRKQLMFNKNTDCFQSEPQNWALFDHPLEITQYFFLWDVRETPKKTHEICNIRIEVLIFCAFLYFFQTAWV